MFHLNQTIPIAIREGFFAGGLHWLEHLPNSCLLVRKGIFVGVLRWLVHHHRWHSTVMWQGSIFGCFSQGSVIIKAVKHG